MKAEAKSLRFLGESPQKITVPFFQRRYVWEESNWQELFDNVSDSQSKPFLGSIIIKTIPGQNPSEAVVVDGQQRLTTLTLLAKVIYDSLNEAENEGVKSDIKNFLFYKINSADPFRCSDVKLCHSKSDSGDYNYLIRAGLLNDTIIDPNTLIDMNSNILKCYKFFSDQIRDKSDDFKKQLHNNLFNEDRKMIVLVTLDEIDVNEQSIFDSINRTGVRLNSADIIKNFLFQKCLDKCNGNRESVYKVYDENWGDYFYLSNGFENLWDKERSFGNNQRTNLEFLLYCVAIIKWGWSDRVFSDLPSVYRSETSEYTFDNFIDLIKDIRRYAKIFYDNVLDLQRKLASEEPVLFSYREYKARFLLILEKFGVQMFYPYIVKAIADNSKEIHLIEQSNISVTEKNSRLQQLDCQFKSELNKLESFIVRNRILKNNVSDYASKCSALIHRENGISPISNWFQQDSDLKNSGIARYLDEVNSDTAKMLLFNIELYLSRGAGDDINELIYKYSLEHIMPKTWTTYWSGVQIVNEEGRILSFNGNNNPLTIQDQEAIAYRNSFLNNIGNMTLLTKALNSAIKNSVYSSKVEGIGNIGGYSTHTSLKITRMLVTAYQQGETTWNELNIRARKNYFMSIISQLWPEV
jgi:hypothetical protein